MSRTMTTTARRVVAGAAALSLVLAACGDDDEDAGTTDTTAAEDDSAEYCALAEELDAQDEFFTADQLRDLQAVAPAAISEEIDTVVPILVEAIEAGDPFAAFEDPVVEENIGAIETYEDEVCGLGDDADEGDDEGAAPVEIAPEDEDYCAIATIVNEQDEFPSPEQLEELRATAPDEIADEADTVVEAFIAAGDDPFAAFEAPGVEEAFEVIEPFDEEHCGIVVEDGEEDGDGEQDPSLTEPDESAAQVAVAATDYAFAFDPAAPAAGRTQFTMTNEGDERHVMYLFKLSDGATIDEVLESEGEEGYDFDAESDTAAAGEEAILTVDLTPGDWAMICYIPTAEGTPHFVEGMQTAFTVQ
jgi:hypothetical protein